MAIEHLEFDLAGISVVIIITRSAYVQEISTRELGSKKILFMLIRSMHDNFVEHWVMRSHSGANYMFMCVCMHVYIHMCIPL